MKILRKLKDEFNILPRAWMAYRYLRGRGLEIGALATPLRVPSAAKVEYLDVATRDESIRKFPELNPRKIVHVDYVSDGFLLNGVADSRFDFVIANHVLEHAANPVKTLFHWHRVLKPGGLVFCSVPRLDRSFDKGRAITAISHMFEDFALYEHGDEVGIRERNKAHYKEWLEISEPTILKRPAFSGDELDGKITEMLNRREEIHFHTFSRQSVEALFNELEKKTLPGISIQEIVQTRIEIIVISKKKH